MSEVGIMSPQGVGMTWREALDVAQLAEQLGYSSLSEGESWGQDAFTRLSWLASATTRIRIGTSIVPVFGRSPANLAMTALSLDWITQGRFFLGLGTTGQLVVEAFHGLPFEKPIGRLRDYISVVRKALRHERLDHDGECVSLHHFQLRFEPVRADMPILVGCQSPRTLRLAGEMADGWLPIFFAPGRMDSLMAEVDAGLRAGGRPWSAFRVSPQVSAYLTSDVPAARDLERPNLAFFIGAQGPYFHRHMHHIGFGAEADRIRQALSSGDFAAACREVTDELVDAVTILGDAGQCRDQIQRFLDSGADEVRLTIKAESKSAFLQAIKELAPRS